MQTRTKTRALFDALDTEEHRRWKQDRDVRRRMPPAIAWRGCVGLAAMLHDPETVVDVPAAGRRLVPNSNVAWVALRDVPPGHCPGSGPMNRRDINLATVAHGDLHHGMLRIDFTAAARDSWDLRFIPYGDVSCRLGGKPWERVTVRRPATRCTVTISRGSLPS